MKLLIDTHIFLWALFDRMLVWQAICEKYTLVTVDVAFAEYRKAGLKTFG